MVDSLTSLHYINVQGGGVQCGHLDFPFLGLPGLVPAPLPHTLPVTSWLSLSLGVAFLEALLLPIYSWASAFVSLGLLKA